MVAAVPGLVARVIEELVKFRPRLHPGQNVPLVPGRVKVAQSLLRRPHRHPERRQREQHHRVPHRPERRHVEIRPLAELRHVGEQRRLHRAGEPLELVRRFQRFREDRVRPGVEVQLRPTHRVVEPGDAARVRSSDDDERRVAPRRDRRSHLRHHHLGLGERLPGEVPAPLRHHLVFKVNPRDASGLKEPHSALDVQRLAEPGVGVAEEREAGRLRGQLRRRDELGDAEQADVGDAVPGRQRAAGEVDGAEADPLGEPGRQRVEDAGDGDRPVRPRVAEQLSR